MMQCSFCRGFVAGCAVGGRWHRWEAGGTPKSPEGSGRSPAHTGWPAAGARDVRTNRDLSSGANAEPLSRLKERAPFTV